MKKNLWSIITRYFTSCPVPCFALSFLLVIMSTSLYAPPKQNTAAPGRDRASHAHQTFTDDGGPVVHPSAQLGAKAGALNSLTINFSNANSSNQAALQEAQQAQAQRQEQVQQQEQFQSMTMILNISANLESFLSANKWKLLFGFLCVGYAGLYKRLKDDQAFLKSQYRWANWRPYNEYDLEQSLINDIQCRYFDPENPTNYEKPLVQFARTLDYEKKRCSTFMWLYQSLKDWCLDFFMPVSRADMRKAQRSKEQLEALRRLYLGFIANRNARACLPDDDDDCCCHTQSSCQRSLKSCQHPTN